MKSAPTYQLPPLDPLVTQAQQTAQSQLISGLQTRARGDTASLMQQYGALAAAYGAPTATPSVVNTGGLPPSGRAA